MGRRTHSTRLFAALGRSEGIRVVGVLFFGAVAGVLGLFFWLGSQEHSAAQAGLGIRTVSGTTVHPLGPFEFDSNQSLMLPNAMKVRALPRKALQLGASQLYGINNLQPGDRTVGYRLFDALSRDGVDLGVVGLANATPREHLVLFTHFLSKIDLELLVLGAVYDDTRHPEIRPWIKELARRPNVISILSRFNASFDQAENKGLRRSPAPVRPSEQSDESLMQIAETGLTDALEAAFGLETLRREGRANVLLLAQDVRRFFETLRARWTRDLSRYRVLIPPDSYAPNMAALEAMLELARMRDVRVLLYVAPRPDDFFPYDGDGYALYKNELVRLAERHNARLINLEDAVPSRYFGLVDITFGFPYRDPFHFNGEGHALMAKVLLPEIRKILEIGR